VVDLSTRIVNPGDYLEPRPAAVNNRGQITITYKYSVNPNIAPFQAVGPLDSITQPSAEQSAPTFAARLRRPVAPLPEAATYQLNGVTVPATAP
jgi:hypothetical protein